MASNADKLNPIVEIDIEGHTIPIKFGSRAIRRFEAETGKSLFSGELLDDVGLNDCILLLWAGQLHLNPKFKIEAVESFFDEVVWPKGAAYIAEVTTELIKVFNEALRRAAPPESKKNEEDETEQPKEVEASPSPKPTKEATVSASTG